MSQAQNIYLHGPGQTAFLILVAAASSKFIKGSSIYANLIGAGIGSVTIILSKRVADPDESAISSFARVTGCVALGILATWGISKLPVKLLKDHVTFTPRAAFMNGLIATVGLVPIAFLSAANIVNARHDNFIKNPTDWTNLTDKQRKKFKEQFSKANLTPIGTKEAKPTKETDKPELPKLEGLKDPNPPKPKEEDNRVSSSEKKLAKVKADLKEAQRKENSQKNKKAQATSSTDSKKQVEEDDPGVLSPKKMVLLDKVETNLQENEVLMKQVEKLKTNTESESESNKTETEVDEAPEEQKKSSAPSTSNKTATATGSNKTEEDVEEIGYKSRFARILKMAWEQPKMTKCIQATASVVVLIGTGWGCLAWHVHTMRSKGLYNDNGHSSFWL